MQQLSRRILEEFGIRKNKKQKTRFIEEIRTPLEAAEYSVSVEEKGGARNIVIGDVRAAKLLFTAHYDTCAAMPFPNFITPKNMLFYGLFQLLIAVLLLLPATAALIVLLNLGYFLPANAAFLALIAATLFLLLMGPANRNNRNDNSSGVVTVLEIALSLPAAQRETAAFVLFDLEELGMVGSSAFAKKHKAQLTGKTVINFDCVSDGGSVHLCLTKKLKKDARFIAQLEDSIRSQSGKAVVVESGFFFYPSDQMMFDRGVGVCALKQSRILGAYIDRIHTRRDVVFQEENIQLLKDGALRLIAQYDSEKAK